MKYICAQPATTYFAWQIDVLVSSLIKNNVKPEDIHVICSVHWNPKNYYGDLMQKHKGVGFFFYKDTRDYKAYIPSIKQHLMHKHYLANPYMEEEAIFFIDADVCLTKPLDLEPLLKDNIWYGSDTVSYIGYDYILSKGRDILEKMLEIADISEDIVKSNQNAAIGAQYLYKNVKADFWREVVDMSHDLYRETSVISKKKKELDPDYHEIQIWTAEMWAMLWVAWKKGIMTCVSKKLDFCWSTDPIAYWDERAIYHNAGAINDNDGVFWKAKFIESFPPKDLKIRDNICCHNYYELIKNTI